ncbi:hypothetical protein ACDX66_09730 [Peribacillus frigoritolerans]
MSFGLLLVSLEQILVSLEQILVSLEQILVSLEQILVSLVQILVSLEQILVSLVQILVSFPASKKSCHQDSDFQRFNFLLILIYRPLANMLLFFFYKNIILSGFMAILNSFGA